MRFLLPITCIALVACLPSVSETGGTIVGGGGESMLLVRNESDQVICFVNITEAPAQDWGPDRLGSDEVVAQGEARGWRMPEGRYDIRLSDCNRDVLLERRAVTIESDGALLSFRRRE